MSQKNSNELLKTVVTALEDVKGQSITVFDTQDKTSAFDHVVIASGTSNRQTRALADSVCKAVKHAGFKVSGLEGTETGEWVLVDCGGVIVHCMQPSIRQYYNLEELWGPDALDLKALFAKKPAKAAAKKTAAKKTSAPAKKAPAKKPAAKKPAVKKTTTAKKTIAKKTAVKSTVKTASKKTPAKKATTKKPAAKKTTKV